MIGNSNWLPFLLAGIYLLFIGAITFKTKMFKPFIIYGIMIQVFFLTYWFFTRSKLQGISVQGISEGEALNLYNQFLTVIGYAYFLVVAPIFSAIIVRSLAFFRKKITNNGTRIIVSSFFVIILASIVYIFGYVFIIIYYGLAP